MAEKTEVENFRLIKENFRLSLFAAGNGRFLSFLHGFSSVSHLLLLVPPQRASHEP